VINREKLLAALAHCPLCGKKIFGSSFVSNERIRGNILRAIYRLRAPFARAADEAAAFLRRSFAGMGDDCVDLNLRELKTQGKLIGGAVVLAPLGARYL